MFQFGTLRKLFSQKRGVSLAAAFATAVAAVGATRDHTAAADAPAETTKATSVVSATPPSGNGAPLPIDKLSCKMGALPPRTPVVLLCCGSFNPPTIMHMRIVDLAADELMRRGYDVWGAYLSPVADAYGKVGLAPAADRVAMCRLAAEDESRGLLAVRGSTDEPRAARTRLDASMELTMVYDWEARQPGYTRTLAVLRRVESELRNWASGSRTAAERAPEPSHAPSSAGGGGVCEPVLGEGSAAKLPAPTQQQPSGEPVLPQPTPTLHQAAPVPAVQLPPRQQPQEVKSPAVQAMLLCGGDVLASMAVPGVWRDPDVILREHGVVCVAREGTDLERLLSQPGSVLYDYRDRIVVVYDRVGNSVSSSMVREELAACRPVRYLVPPSVLSYIFGKGLYGTGR